MAKHSPIKDPASEVRVFTSRTLLAAIIIIVLVLILIGRFFTLQVLEHDSYRTQSDRNRVHVQSIPPKRGLIFDRNGILLAENIPSHTLVLVRERVKNMPQTLDTLRNLLALSDDEIEKFQKRLTRHRPFEEVPLRFKLSEQEIAILSVNHYRLPGVEVIAQLVRHYPKGEFFAHSVGYVGRINEREQKKLDAVNYAGTYSVGKVGLEKYYETQLHGEVGFQNVETNARGKVLRVLERTDPVPGKDLHLYIDSTVQQVAYEALGNNRGSVVAIDVRTGAVLAIVSTPSYDSNLFVTGISNKNYAALRDSPDLPLFNRSLQGQYPPASTIKPLMGLAGLHYKIINKNSKVPDPGWFQLPNDERLYRDWKAGGHAKFVNLEQAIIESCDVFFFNLAYKMGVDRIHNFLGNFGLGEKTGIDLTSERSGLLPSRQWKRRVKKEPWFSGETVNIGIGQGYMLVTPVQLAVATATVASRGIRRQPRLLKRLGEEAVVPKSYPPIKLNNSNAWSLIANAMKKVVHSHKGTARNTGYGLSYKMAGKTGTAQVISIKQDEKYDAELIAKRNWDHALFVGFAPFDNPAIAVAVIVENGEHGSSAAAPVARKVMDAYLLGTDKQLLEQFKQQSVAVTKSMLGKVL